MLPVQLLSNDGCNGVGYGFAKDYNAPRGHFYALQSNQNTLRTGAPVDEKTGPMPTACWTCKSPDVVRMIDEDGSQHGAGISQ